MAIKIQVLGTGCPRCDELMATTRAAAEELGIEFELEKVSRLADIAALGVMVTPGLVVDGDVKVTVKVPSKDEIKELLGPAK